MQLGTLVHMAILEPEAFRLGCVRSEKFDRRTREGKLDAASFERMHEGKMIVDPETYDAALAVRESALKNRIVRTLVEETPPELREHTIAWDCHETGLPCKSRRDLNHRNLLGDLKTLSLPMSASAAAKRIASLGYHRQAAFYRYGEQQFSGELKPFVFIFLGTKPPYSVGLFDIDADDLNFADKQNMETLAAMASCRADAERYVPDYANQICTVCLPKWARYEDEYGF
jgi:exodeoxyribonuclease VIII